MSSNKQEKKFEFALSKENYILMAIGFAIVILGFILMIGGRSEDPNVFNEEIYGFQRITLAPMLVLAGFAFEVYAIMKKPKEKK